MLFSSVFAITERRDMGLYGALVYVFVVFMDGDYVSQLPYAWYYVGVKRNASPRGPMCFRCLMFSLSGTCELLFFTLFYCLLDMSCGECGDVISLYVMCFSVNGYACLVCCVFDSIMEVLSVGGGGLLDKPCMVF